MIFQIDPKLIQERLCDPVESTPWCKDPVLPDMVTAALRENRLRPEFVTGSDYENPVAHAERIAWLITDGWDDPIEIDVGIPSLGGHPQWPILDGNHRLYAAIHADYRQIPVSISGSLDHAAELFNIDPGIIAAAFEDIDVYP